MNGLLTKDDIEKLVRTGAMRYPESGYRPRIREPIPERAEERKETLEEWAASNAAPLRLIVNRKLDEVVEDLRLALLGSPDVVLVKERIEALKIP